MEQEGLLFVSGEQKLYHCAVVRDTNSCLPFYAITAYIFMHKYTSQKFKQRKQNTLFKTFYHLLMDLYIKIPAGRTEKVHSCEKTWEAGFYIC